MFYFSIRKNRNRRRQGVLFSLAVLAIAAVVALPEPAVSGQTAVFLHARPWPAADRLFKQDPRWRGGDGAHSVDLGAGRVLWLFGDSLISAHGGKDRSRTVLIRNSIAIQTGKDPSSAAMAFFWGESAAQKPASFFPESGRTWLWPGDGIRLGRHLLIFHTRIEPSSNDLGFTVTGWQGARVENPDQPPDRWHFSDVRKQPGKFAVALGGGGVLRRNGYIYAYGAEPGGNQAYLARWPEEKAGAGDLREPQWWCGPGLGWKGETEMEGAPVALFENAQAEFGVHFEPRSRQYLQIQTMGFGAVGLGFRLAPRPEGPWGVPSDFYLPEEVSIPGILIYAAKSHPFLTGADLVITYATNHVEPQRLIKLSTLYYPRFLKVDIRLGDWGIGGLRD